MIILRTCFNFGRAIKRPLKASAKQIVDQKIDQPDVEPVVEQQKFEKKFEDSTEFRIAHNHLPALDMPQEILAKARKVFSKYDSNELRDASYKYMRIYQLLHALEKPRAITLKNALFENVEDLQRMTDKNIIHLRKPGSEDELWVKINEKKLQKEAQKDRLKVEEEPTTQQRSLIDYDQAMVVSYLLRKVPGSYSAGMKILKELRKRNPSFNPRTYLDYGSGLSPWSWAVNSIFPDTATLACVEPNQYMRKLGKFMNDHITQVKFFESLSHTLELNFETFDLISLAFVLEEIASPEQRLLTLQTLYAKLSDNGIMILACPGSPTGFRFVNDFREWIINQKGYIVAPCQHQQSCPLAKDGFQWCHFDQQYFQWPKNVFPKHMHEKTTITEKFSYLIVAKHELKSEGKSWDRIVFPILKRGQHMVMDVCSTEGEFERRVIAKSHGKEGGYYECKKLKSGDLWRFPKKIASKLLKKHRIKTVRKL